MAGKYHSPDQHPSLSPLILILTALVYVVRIYLIYQVLLVHMEQHLQGVIFYTIEKAIKSYRQFAQAELKKNGLEITIDQWLALRTLSEKPGISQKELAETVFKDEASVTRILSLLTVKKYLEKRASAGDGRRSEITITKKGRSLLQKTEKVVMSYRAHALKGLSQKEISQASATLNKIIANCR